MPVFVSKEHETSIFTTATRQRNFLCGDTLLHQDADFPYETLTPQLQTLAVPLLVGPSPDVFSASPVDYTTIAKKPPHSYAKLISMAIKEAPGEKISLTDIYRWIQDSYLYYKTVNTTWRSSIRQNLRFNKAFLQRPSRHSHRKARSVWTIRAEDRYTFLGRSDENYDNSVLCNRTARSKRHSFKRRHLQHFKCNQTDKEESSCNNGRSHCLTEIIDNSSNDILDLDVDFSSRENVDFDNNDENDLSLEVVALSQAFSTEDQHSLTFSRLGEFSTALCSEEKTLSNELPTTPTDERRTSNPAQCMNGYSLDSDSRSEHISPKFGIFECMNELEIK